MPLASLLALLLSLISRGIGKLLALALVLAVVFLWLSPTFHDVSLGDSESIGLTYYFFALAFLLAKTPFPRLTNAIGGAFVIVARSPRSPTSPSPGSPGSGAS